MASTSRFQYFHSFRRISNFRYGGLKQSKSCYEKEGATKMCTTINCEFQNTGRECNETITAVNVSVAMKY